MIRLVLTLPTYVHVLVSITVHCWNQFLIPLSRYFEMELCASELEARKGRKLLSAFNVQFPDSQEGIPRTCKICHLARTSCQLPCHYNYMMIATHFYMCMYRQDHSISTCQELHLNESNIRRLSDAESLTVTKYHSHQ